MSDSDTVLEADSMSVRYRGVHAVQGFSTSVRRGETVALLGANGAGKSSIIHAIIGLVPIAEGRVTFVGQDITKMKAPERARRGIRISPEGRLLFQTMTVEENVLAGCYGMRSSEREKIKALLFDKFPLLAERRKQPAGTLSGGQQQIVTIARALSAHPKLLLLDEPFLGLSPVWIDDTSKAIRAVQEEGTTVIISEQMARPALNLASRGYVIRGGVVRRSGPVNEIRSAALAEDYL